MVLYNNELCIGMQIVINFLLTYSRIGRILIKISISK
jgi:hypothetical protein